MIPRLGTVTSLLRDAPRGASYLAGLWLALRRPVPLGVARRVLEARLRSRAEDFLALSRRTIYANRSSPYRALLRHVGCEPGDLERLVCQDGVEGALASLFRQGVYLSVSELKGREEVSRGSLRLRVGSSNLLSPRRFVPDPITLALGHSAPVLPLHAAMFRDAQVNAALWLEARGGGAWRSANCGRSAGESTTLWLMRYQVLECRSVRSFTTREPEDRAISPRQYAIGSLAPLVSRLAGSPLPWAERMPPGDWGAILRWFDEERSAGRTPHLSLPVSFAVALCDQAVRSGRDLEGVQLSVASEMLTDYRLAAIRRSGAAALPLYGAREAGLLAHGCVQPTVSDDMHLATDLHSVIQAGPVGAAIGLPERALLVSSLRYSWPNVLFNVSLGDEAELVERSCGCLQGALGWTTHVQRVRSFEKLSLGGVSILIEDIVRILEVELPRRFGGGPTDYQLVLESDPARPIGPRLLIDPNAGDLEPAAVAEALRGSLRAAGLPTTFLWTGRDGIVVERRAPIRTPGGKMLPVYDASRSRPDSL